MLFQKAKPADALNDVVEKSNAALRVPGS